MLGAVQAIVGKLQTMSADAAAGASLDELREWTLDAMKSGADLKNADLTDADIIDRQTRIIRLSQAARRVNGDPKHVHFQAIAWSCISMAERRWMDDPTINAIWTAMDVIKQREGLDEDDDWSPDEGPADYRDLVAKHDDRHDQIVADIMRDMGEADMAALYLTDRADFDQRYEQGRLIVFGPMPDVGTPGLAK